MESQPPQPVPTGQPLNPQASPSPSSSNSIMALILGILSIPCCGFISGIPAIFLGRSELKAIEQGKIPATNRTMAKAGMILGIIGTILSLLGTLVYIILIAMGISAGMLQHGIMH
jgi:hypothetical protein